MNTIIDDILALRDLYEDFYIYDDGECEVLSDFDGNEIDISDYDYEYGASKIVFIFGKYVVKIPLAGKIFYNRYEDRIDVDYINEINYCGKEIDIYKRAKRAGIEKFFLKSRFLDECSEVQEKGDEHICFSSYDGDNIKISDSFSRYAREHLSGDVLKILSEYYTSKEISKFSNFIEENKVNDLSCHNMIMKNGRPVFMDYSGYLFEYCK